MAARVFEIISMETGKYGVCIKMQRGSETRIKDVFGTRLQKLSETYYKWFNSGPESEMSSDLVVGGTITLDPDEYVIRKKDWPLPSTGEIIELSYLYDKVAE